MFIFLMTTHLLVRSYLLSSLDRRLKASADRTVENASRPVPPPADRDAPPPPPEPERRGRRERLVRMFDLDGRPMVIPGTASIEGARPWDEKAFTRAAAGEMLYTNAVNDEVPYRIYTSTATINEKKYVVQSATNITDVNDVLNNLTTTLALLAPLALIIAGLGGLLITNRALSPIRRIVDAANEMKSEDISKRLPAEGSDEFADLAGSINELLCRLEEGYVQLNEAFQREKQFTADASHELKTPLTAIKANTSLILRGKRTPEQYEEAIQAIDQSTDTVNRLVQDLLLLAHSDSGQLTQMYEEVQTADLLSEAVSSAQKNAPVEIRNDAETVTGDPEQFKRLLVNLIDNAQQHTPSDGKITVGASQTENGTVITVADTGEGIAEEHIPHLCERFYRIDPSRTRNTGGTGLGLAICKSIVDSHGGAIKIESTPGEGTIVTVTIPKPDSEEETE